MSIAGTPVLPEQGSLCNSSQRLLQVNLRPGGHDLMGICRLRDEDLFAEHVDNHHGDGGLALWVGGRPIALHWDVGILEARLL